MKLPDIREVKDLRGKKVLVRGDLDVPIVNGVVANNFRLRKMLPMLIFLKEQGARTILIGHRGREGKSLRPIFEALSEHITLSFSEETLSNRTERMIEVLQDGDMILLENLRRDTGEGKNDISFAVALAKYGELYVNEAFSVSHRVHASVVGVPQQLPHYAGIHFQEEIEQLSSAAHPGEKSLFILGGAKFETKEPLIRKYLSVYDHIFIGGALANDFFKAKGFEVGKSLLSKKEHYLTDLLESEKCMLPNDVVVTHENNILVKKPEEVEEGDVIVDVGPGSIAQLASTINDAQFVLWNGPLGNYEAGFKDQTEALAQMLAESGAKIVIGGGDTVVTVTDLDLEDEFSFISVGGGAMLQFLHEGTLPGIVALTGR